MAFLGKTIIQRHKMRVFLIFSAVYLTIFSTIQARACSVFNYVKLTNYELVQMTDEVVIATAESSFWNFSDGVVFQVDKILKGTVPQKLTIKHAVLGNPDPSNSNDISEPHPEAYAGPCNRMSFKEGHQYVLFLNRTKEGGFVNGGYPFSRINEDYFGENSLWIKTIKYYLQIQKAYSPMKQLDILKAKHDELLAGDITTDNQKLAADIVDHLSSRSPYKPTEYLINSYEALDEKQDIQFAVRNPDADKEKSHAQVLTDMLFDIKSNEAFDINEQKKFIMWSLVNGDHPKALTFFEELAQDPLQTGAVLGAIVKYYSKNNKQRQAIEIANKHAFRIMNNAPKAEVDQFLRGIMAVNSFEKGGWGNNELMKSWWPEFAVTLNAILRNRFGADHTYSFDEEYEYLRPKSYRDRPDITLGLVRSYDEKVVKWAENEVQRLLKQKVEAFEKLYRLPIGVLLEDYRSDETEKIDNLFCESKTSRYAIIKYLGLHKDIYVEELALRISAYDLSDEEKDTLLKSLSIFSGDAHKSHLSEKGSWLEDDDAFDLMSALLKGETIDLKKEGLQPIKCN